MKLRWTCAGFVGDIRKYTGTNWYFVLCSPAERSSNKLTGEVNNIDDLITIKCSPENTLNLCGLVSTRPPINLIKHPLDIPEHIWSVEDKWWMQYWVDKTWTQDLWGCPVVLVMDPCVLWDGRRGLHRSGLLWHVRWMLQPDLQIPNAIEHLLSDSMEEPLWIAAGSDPSKSGHRTPEGVPWCVIRGVGKGSFESCGLWVEDSVNPTCSGTSQRCWKATAVGGVLLWRGVNSTLSRSLGGWCVLNCIPHENHKVSQHNTAL